MAYQSNGPQCTIVYYIAYESLRVSKGLPSLDLNPTTLGFALSSLDLGLTSLELTLTSLDLGLTSLDLALTSIYLGLTSLDLNTPPHTL